MPTDTTTAAKPGRVLTVWTPEDKAFWEQEGRAIANSNLWISMPALFLAFAVWQLWSVVAVNLPVLGFKFTPNELFWLAAAPGSRAPRCASSILHGAGIRRPALDRVLDRHAADPGDRHRLAMQDPATSYPTLLVLALLCGFGGGNFASSMANISFFFPKERKGSALGLNAGLGNLGVSAVQFLAPLVVAAGVYGPLGRGAADHRHRRRPDGADLGAERGFVWVPFIILASIAAWFGMNDIADAKASFARAGRDLPAQAQLADVLALPRHLRLVHRLSRRAFRCSSSRSSRASTHCNSRGSDRWWARSCGRSAAGSPTSSAAPRVTLWNFIVMSARGRRRPLLPALGRLGRQLRRLSRAASWCSSHHRHRQRLDVPHDPRDLPHRAHRAMQQARARPRRSRRVKDANKESAAVLGFASAFGGLRRLLHPEEYGTAIST